MNARRLGSVSAGLVLALLIACGGAGDPPETRNPLFVDPVVQDFSRRPELIEDLRGDPHRYFRFINVPFSQEVCRRYGKLAEDTPIFNLHGDAHIEQYAITDIGRGLTDFDDSSSGPALIDLLRFGVSLRVACHDYDCGDDEAIFNEFLAGYRAALENPELEAPEPAVARQLRQGFVSDRQAYLKWVDTVMEPMPLSEREALASAMQPYAETMLAQQPELERDYFDLVAAGYLKMGVGSALSVKYLVRTRGPSDRPEDDAVLEVKEVRALDEIECIRVSEGSDPFRVLLGQARIAYEPFKHLGYIRIADRSFWIHAWVENYKELEVGKTLRTPEEIAEVAYDVGVQLGRGHSNQIGAPLDQQLRGEQLRMLERDRGDFGRAVTELTELTLDAWKRFRAEALPEPG